MRCDKVHSDPLTDDARGPRAVSDDQSAPVSSPLGTPRITPLPIVGRSCQSPWTWSNRSGRLAGDMARRGIRGRRPRWPAGRRRHYGSAKGSADWSARGERHSGRGLGAVPCYRQLEVREHAVNDDGVVISFIRPAQRGQRRTSRSKARRISAVHVQQRGLAAPHRSSSSLPMAPSELGATVGDDLRPPAARTEREPRGRGSG
jgi:hypothetical protein